MPSLRRAGIPNKVVALRNGTMGWELAGLTCEHGRPERFQPGLPRTAALALDRARAFAAGSGVREISEADLRGLEADKSRTLYVLDVRDPQEFRAGHRPGSLNAPGQLQPGRQSDSDEAAMTCLWLLSAADCGAGPGSFILPLELAVQCHFGGLAQPGPGDAAGLVKKTCLPSVVTFHLEEPFLGASNYWIISTFQQRTQCRYSRTRKSQTASQN